MHSVVAVPFLFPSVRATVGCIITAHIHLRALVLALRLVALAYLPLEINGFALPTCVAFVSFDCVAVLFRFLVFVWLLGVPCPLSCRASGGI